jgi:hypothetical protein
MTVGVPSVSEFTEIAFDLYNEGFDNLMQRNGSYSVLLLCRNACNCDGVCCGKLNAVGRKGEEMRHRKWARFSLHATLFV